MRAENTVREILELQGHTPDEQTVKAVTTKVAYSFLDEVMDAKKDVVNEHGKAERSSEG